MALVNLAARLFPLVPRRLVQRFSRRYIAGVGLEEAIRVATGLRERGMLVTLDILGESVRTTNEAHAYVGDYVDALRALDEAGLQPHVSVKPSALGSLVSWRVCEDSVASVADAAEACGGIVCMDMEWAHAIDQTLTLYRSFRAKELAGVTTVVQARLHRTRSDLVELASLAPHVRICKGIYPEPAQIAYTDREAIRRNYIFCLDTLLACGGYAAIATHDEALVVAGLERLAERRYPSDGYEFQTLLGVREDLAEALAASGHRVRVYVPYGKDRHAYAVRRFRESPQALGYVAHELGRGAVTRCRRRSTPSGRAGIHRG